MNNLQIYVNGEYHAEVQRDTVLLTLNGVDASQVLAEFGTDDKLDSIDFAEIVDYITRQQQEE